MLTLDERLDPSFHDVLEFDGRTFVVVGTTSRFERDSALAPCADAESATGRSEPGEQPCRPAFPVEFEVRVLNTPAVDAASFRVGADGCLSPSIASVLLQRVASSDSALEAVEVRRCTSVDSSPRPRWDFARSESAPSLGRSTLADAATHHRVHCDDRTPRRCLVVRSPPSVLGQAPVVHAGLVRGDTFIGEIELDGGAANDNAVFLLEDGSLLLLHPTCEGTVMVRIDERGARLMHRGDFRGSVPDTECGPARERPKP